MPVIASRSDLSIMVVLLVLVLLAPAVPAYLYYAYEPVRDDDLAQVEGRLKNWKENSLGRPSDIQGGSRRDLWIFLEGDDATYVVGEDIYSASWFNAAGFKRSVTDGSPLTLTVTKKDLASSRIRDVYGLRTAAYVYLSVESARADDEASQRKMLYIALTMLLVCPAIGFVLFKEIRRYLASGT